MKRPELPVPDPAESIILSSRPAFGYVKNQDGPWLPDISMLSPQTPEALALELDDELDVLTFRRCPHEAGFPELPTEVPHQAEEIGQWVFETYFKLVSHRIGSYNRARKKANISKFTDRDENEYYKLVSRLLIEQILRRDLPLTAEFDLGYPFTVLPIFELQIQFVTEPNTKAATYENVLKMTVAATVEIRQRNGLESLKQFEASFALGPKVALRESQGPQPSWSSSSSSSSSSESSYDSN
jgi:hypothetical protein